MDAANNSLDDLIFSHRNKDYGAYANRKNYHRYLFRAMFIATSLFCAGVSVPLIANYLGADKTKETIVTHINDTLITIDIEKQKVPEPPVQKTVKPEYSYSRIVPTVDTTQLLADLSELQGKIDNKPPDELIGDTAQGPEPEKPKVIDDEKIQGIYISPQVMPEFPGGDAGRLEYLAENIVYPVSDKRAEIDGTVYIGFVVDEKGMVCDVKVIRGVSPGIDAEAVRVVQGMPRWSPGMQNGQMVKVAFTMPIRFVLH